MKIALISTPWLSVPPVGYGGTEAVVYNLCEGLVRRGHDVTLHATGDSKTSAHLTYFFPEAVSNNYFLKLNPYYKLNHLFKFFKEVNDGSFDIIHNHAGRVTSFFLDLQKTPFVHTLHGNYNATLDDEYHSNSSARESMLLFKNHPYISISDRQRQDIPELNFVTTIYNSVILEKLPFYPENKNQDIVWLGRVSKTKGIENLIEVAKKVKKNLKLATFVDKGEQEYFDTVIKPLLEDPLISNLGEINDDTAKSQLFASGKVFLFPINWDEPFGIVVIEAMATGTPVVAFARGSVPEIVRDGETGFIVNPSDEDIRGDWIVKKTGIEGLCEAVERIYSLPIAKYQEMRKACRSQVEKNFTVNIMVEKYEKVYQKVLEMNKSPLT